MIRVDGNGEIGRTVCGIGGPTGVDGRIVSPPQVVEHRWFGTTPLGGRLGHPFPVQRWLFPQRSGVSIGMPSAYTVTIAGHVSFGDSGAPVLSEDGHAVGWVSGPPQFAEELSHGGSFVVSRIGPAIDRAGEVLGISLTLATAPH